MRAIISFLAILPLFGGCKGSGGAKSNTSDSTQILDVSYTEGDMVLGETDSYVPPKECSKDEDCTFANLVRLGKVSAKTCQGDADCQDDPKAPVCHVDLGICGCKDDLDCFPDSCNPETWQCASSCFTTAECGEGKECLNGFCVDMWACNCDNKCVQARCKEHKNCGSELYCDACSKTCVRRLPACGQCEEDYQCEQEAKCIQEFELSGVHTTMPYKFCAPWCPLATGICVVDIAPVGFFACANIGNPTDGACVPSTLDCGKLGKRCTSDADCDDPVKQKCWEDRQVCGCRDITSCPFGQICHPVTHVCVQGCQDDNECGNDKVCAAGLCRDKCQKFPDGTIKGCDDPVPMEGKQWDCDTNGHCFVPGMCFTPFDCLEKETYCDTETHECKSGCMIDYDCKAAAMMCLNGKCVPKPCMGNYECSCGEVCEKQTGQCKPAEGKYCAPCDPNAGDQACGDKDTLCVDFQDENGNSKGSYCLPPCGPDPENPCPQGWQCIEVKDTQGKSYGKKCFRYCYHYIEGCAIGNPPQPDASPETGTIPDP